MAVYGVSYYGVGTYGFPSAIALQAGNFAIRPEGYDKLFLSWNKPAGTWTYMRLVRSSYGFPAVLTDGDTLFEDTYAAARISYMDGDAPTKPLKSGRFYYYTLFVFLTAENVWFPVGHVMELVPTDYGTGERMWDLLPEVHREQDRSYADVSGTGPLYRFLALFGFQYDRLRTEIDTLMHAYDIDRVSGGLLPVLSQMFGVDNEVELGQLRVRSILKNRIHLLKSKGTKPGIEGAVSAYTGFGATAVIGPNLMLDYNDSDAAEGVGRWVATNGALTRTPEASFSPPIVGVDNHTITGNGSTPTTVLLGTFVDRTLLPVLPSTAYVFSSYVRTAVTGRTVSFDIIWYRADGTVSATTVGATVADTTAWVRRNVTATSPADAAFAQIRYNGMSFANAEVHYFAANQWERGTTPTTWQSARQVNVYVDPDRRNAVPNPSAEVDTTGWANNANATLTRSTTVGGQSGTAAFRMSSIASGTMSVTTPTGTSGIPVTPSQYQTLSVYFRAGTVNRTGRVWLSWYTAAGAFISDSAIGTTTSATGTWANRASITALAPSNAAYAAIRVEIQATGGAAELHYFDAVLLEATEFLRSYFDASFSADYLWSGTAHQSVSNYYPRRGLKDYRLRTVLLDYLPAGTSFSLVYGSTAPASSV